MSSCAIVGWDFRFPGADSPEAFWHNLINGVNSVTKIPPERWCWQNFYGDPEDGQNKTNSKWGGFIRNIECFDPLFFNIAPKEANFIDPQHRIFLESAWHVLENAGYRASALAKKRIGVYVGVSKNDYAELLEGQNIEAFVSTGTVHSILANRVSYFLNLTGPSETVDTACSSSLVALSHAVRDIQTGECEAAIVGGVNALLSPRMYISHGKSGMLSPNGRCKSFDAEADGYVRAEGVASLFIKPLDKAVEDRDNILGMIRSIALNHGGRANFLTAPNVEAQTDVVYTALKKANISPLNISYIETHGTGTQLGDPIETKALCNAYRRFYEESDCKLRRNFCGLGSVKTNVGHMESASGMVSIIKVLLGFMHKQVPPNSNFETLNPMVELTDSPFYIVDKLKDWVAEESDDTRLACMAGISSFGMGGANAHVILEEPPVFDDQNSLELDEPIENTLYVVLLSAKKNRLRRLIQSLHAYLVSSSNNAPDLQDIAFTLMFGREVFEHRAVFFVQTLDELKGLLGKCLAGEDDEKFKVNLVTSKHRSTVINAKNDENIIRSANCWAAGDTVEWDKSSFAGRRCQLPGYPFVRRKCWFDTKRMPARSVSLSSPKEADSHSTLKKQLILDFELLNHHLVQSVPTMPGAAYLELLLDQVQHDFHNEQLACQFTDVYWLNPYTLDMEKNPQNAVTLQLDDGVLTARQEAGKFTFQSAGKVFCQGNISLIEVSVADHFDIERAKQRCKHVSDSVQCYQLFEKSGLDYGQSFKVLGEVRLNKNEAVGIVNKQGFSKTLARLIDGAFQAAVYLSVHNTSTDGNQLVPYFCEQFIIVGDLRQVSFYYIIQKKVKAKGLIEFDLFFCDEKGKVLAKCFNFCKKILKKRKAPVDRILYYTFDWYPEVCNARQAGDKQILYFIHDRSIRWDETKLPPGKQITLGETVSQDVNNLLLCKHGAADFVSVFKKIRQDQYVFNTILISSTTPCQDDIHLLLNLLQGLIKSRQNNEIKILYVTEGNSIEDVPFALSVAGLARTLKYEKPNLSLGVVNFDAFSQYSEIDIVNEINSGISALHEVCYREGERCVRRVRNMQYSEKQHPEILQVKAGGVYCLAGGTGGLGSIFANYFASIAKCKIILLGRKAENPAIKALLDKIRSYTCQAEYYSVDIADENRLMEVFSRIRQKYGKIHGVINASGSIEDSFIIRKSWDSFKRVLAPKICGTINLDKATCADKLDFFVLFSSVAAIIPNQGQCDYAVGNSFIDHFACFRNTLKNKQKRHGVTLSINWPLWENGGMQVTAEEKVHLQAVFGMGSLKTADGKKIFTTALNLAPRDSLTSILGIVGDKSKIEKHFHINQETERSVEIDLPKLLKRDLTILFSLCAKLSVADISPTSVLNEMNVDSFILICITRMLNAMYHLDLQPVFLFEYNTLDKIKKYLLKERRQAVIQYYDNIGDMAEIYCTTALLDIENTDMENQVYQKTFDNSEFYMADHIVEGKYNVPGACFIEFARQAGVLAKPGKVLLCLKNNYWAKQLSTSGEEFTAYIRIADSVENPDMANYEIYSSNEQGESFVHAAGSLVFGASSNAHSGRFSFEQIDLNAIKERCDRIWHRRDVYKQIKAEGLFVGETLMPMQDIAISATEGLALLELPKAVDYTWSDYLLHPTMLTGVFQTALINNRFYGDDEREFIPIAIGEVCIFSTIPKICYVYSQMLSDNISNKDIVKYNLTVCDAKGYIKAKLHNFTIKVRNAKAIAASPVMTNEAGNNYLETAEYEMTPPNSEISARACGYIKSLISSSLGVEASEIEDDVIFENYGINSVMIMELNKELEKNFGSGLSKTLFFEYRNTVELAEYFIEYHYDNLMEKLSFSADDRNWRTEPIKIPDYIADADDHPKKYHITPEKVETGINDKRADKYAYPYAKLNQKDGDAGRMKKEIAVIGLAGRFPKAENIENFWENLKSGVDGIDEIPGSRFDYKAYSDISRQESSLYSRWGGFIDGIENFDPEFFGITPVEAELIDPQERLFLQTAWHTLEDGGYTREALSPYRVGVFVGALWQPYLDLAVDARARGELIGASTLLYNIANRVSYYCNFSGPSLAVDTACSASLTALHLGCQSIRSGESDFALIGGVNLSLGVSKYLFLSRNRFLSTDGRCRSFGEGGDGYVPGEGVAAVLLRPLHEAVKAQDNIYAVIKSSAVNHGGKTNGYTVPNPKAQSSVIIKAIEDAGINPNEISYVEAHGTGTALGDPIEITGLTQAFNRYTKKRQFCAIGSVKSNIGHLEACAGLAGLAKILLQIKYKTLVPSLHNAALNPYINFEKTAFVVQRTLAKWERPTCKIDDVLKTCARTACLSSFGAGGANAHAIVQECGHPAEAASNFDYNTNIPVLIVLSAKSDAQLEIMVSNLLQFFNCEKQINLHDLAYTLQVGREAFEKRLAFEADSKEAIVTCLEGVLHKKKNPGVWRTTEKTSAKNAFKLIGKDDINLLLSKWIAEKNWKRLLKLWIGGYEIDWTMLYGSQKFKRISLPGYPFANHYCWLTSPDSKNQGKFKAAIPDTAEHVEISDDKIHPLVHIKTDDSGLICFDSTFGNNDFCLKDHVVAGKNILPGVAYLEMAKAAVRRAAHGEIRDGDYVKLQNVVWITPIDTTEQNLHIRTILEPHADNLLRFSIIEKENQNRLFCQGYASLLSTSKQNRVDLQSIKQQEINSLPHQAFYQTMRPLGYHHGPSFQGVEHVYFCKTETLIKFNLPNCVKNGFDDFYIHPSLMDSPIQVCIGIMLGFEHGQIKKNTTVLPFSLDALEVYGKCVEKMWAVIRPSADRSAHSDSIKLDIDLCDESGDVHLRMLGFCSRLLKQNASSGQISKGIVDNAERTFESMNGELAGMLIPVWDVIESQETTNEHIDSRNTLIISMSPLALTVLKKHYRNASVLDIQYGDNEKIIAKKLSAHQHCSHIIWVSGEAPMRGLIEAGSDELYQKNEICCFRLFKAAHALEFDLRELQWTIITIQGLPVYAYESINDSAGVHGLVGSLAKEYPNWKIRLLDLPENESWPVINFDTLKFDTEGNTLVYRDRFWHQMNLLPIYSDAGINDCSSYRNEGVYVVIGGAGGIGCAWSEYMVHKYKANIVWIGRSEKNELIRDKMDKLAKLGTRPLYITADARDYDALERAYRKIKKHYSAIHGVIHSAIVLRDQSLARMQEDQFLLVSSVKVDVSINMAKIFSGEKLDFVLFLSSLNSFIRQAGQSNYASGCAFKDAFAHTLRSYYSCPVKVINWGYWGSVGVVASEEYRRYMREKGMGSIEPPEAMQALEWLLASPLDQMVFSK